MNIDVHLFSPLKEFAGSADLSISLIEPASVELVLAQLEERFPALRPFLPAVQVVINNELLSRHYLLHDGDVVELRMPMFGG